MSEYILNNKQSELINKTINYAKEFNNFPYKCCGKQPPKNIINDKGPFWFSNEKPPELNKIKKIGLNCVGFINLIRRFNRLQVPGKVTGQKLTPLIKKWPGSTSAWFHYLKNEERLEIIDFKKIYPKGTLLLQDFNSNDQGHVAFTINGENNLFESTIIHSINNKNIDKKYQKVIIEKVKDYYNYKRFTHICLPQNWLLKN